MTRRLLLAAAAAFTLSGILPAAAQNAFPGGKVIKAVVPFAAGSATDIIARLFADAMGRHLNTTVIVENRAGANGMIGADAVAKATPDGYTILIGTNSTNAAAPALYKSVPFNHEKDFAPVSYIGSVPLIVGVAKDSPFKTLSDLVAAAKAKPGQINYASASTSQRVSTEMMASMTGIKLNMVPYRSSPDAVNDLMNGRVDVFVADFGVMLPQVEGDKVRALAVTAASRVAKVPNVPTVDEAAGVKGYELIAWFGAFAPAGTPEPVVKALNEAVAAAAKDGAVRAKLVDSMGMTIVSSTPAELADRVKAESAKWAKAVADAGIEKQ